MAWFKVDDRLWSHPKWLATPPAARGLWTSAGSWCSHQEQDGYVPSTILRILGHSKGHALALVRSGLWREVDGGYEFHGWAEFQPTSLELQAKRAIRADAGRKGGLASGRSRREANASPMLEAKTNPVPSRPDPVTSKEVTSPPTPSRRETQLPDSWTPKPEHQHRAAESGIDILAEVVKFRTHAATVERKAKNWNAAFTMWLIKAAEYAEADMRRERPLDRQAEILRRERAAAIQHDAQQARLEIEQ